MFNLWSESQQNPLLFPFLFPNHALWLHFCSRFFLTLNYEIGKNFVNLFFFLQKLFGIANFSGRAVTSNLQALLPLLLYLICICIYFYLGSSAWVMEIIFIFTEALNCLLSLGAEKGIRSLLLSHILWQNIFDLVLTINLSNKGRRTSQTCFKQDVNRHTYVTFA